MYRSKVVGTVLVLYNTNTGSCIAASSEIIAMSLLTEMKVAELRKSPQGSHTLVYRGFHYWKAGDSIYVSTWHCTLSAKLKCLARVTANEFRDVMYVHRVHYGHNHGVEEYEKFDAMDGELGFGFVNFREFICLYTT